MIPLLNERDITFQLYEVLNTAALLQRPAYDDHSREIFDATLTTARAVAEKYFANHNAKGDANEPTFDGERVHLIPETKAAWDAFAAAGFLAAHETADEGGAQLPEVIFRVVMAYVNAANVSTAAYPFITIGVINLIRTFGSAEQKARYLPLLMSGRANGTMALTEPQAGSSLSDVATEAIPRDDGSYSISGQKIWISGGDHQFAENFVHFTLVRVPGGGPGTKGISLMLIPKFRPENGQLVSNDVATVGDFQKMGQRGYTTTHLVFGENGDCRGWLLGTLHKGLDHMFQMMNGARIHVGRGGAAIATAAYYASRQFALERPQGRRLQAGGVKDTSEGQTLIINHPDVRRMLLTQKAIAEGSLALVLQAGYYSDREKTAADEDEARRYHDLLDLLPPMVKPYPAEAGRRAVDQGVQVLGGAGFCDEYVLQQYYRDVRIMAIYEGTTGIQSLDLLGRKISMNKGQALKFLISEIQQTLEAAAADPELAAYAAQLGEQLKLNQQVLGHLAPLAAQGEFEKMLSDATLYMEFLSNVVVAWQWLKLGLAAYPQRDKPFYAAKVHTMKFFYQYELSRNVSLVKTLLEPERLTLTGAMEVID